MNFTFPVVRCLWFMLEVLMTKNENNSHSFLRKMVENIKQTKDAQVPDDPKANEVSRYYPVRLWLLTLDCETFCIL